jgi:hypothetical protein
MKKGESQPLDTAGKGDRTHGEYRSPSLIYQTADAGLLHGAGGAVRDPLGEMTEALVLFYHGQRWGYSAISHELGISRTSVCNVLRRNGR